MRNQDSQLPEEASEELWGHDTDPDGPGSSFLDRYTGHSVIRLSAGMKVGNFKLIQALGNGAAGFVWEAENETLQSRVALKILCRPSPLAYRGLKQFQLEARAASQTQHEGIVRIYEVGQIEGIYYIAQELVNDGRTFDAVIKEAKNTPEKFNDYYRFVAEFFSRCAIALGSSHDNGIIHRDVKPSNILVTPNLKPKIADFGLALLTGSAAGTHATQTMGFRGTACYSSPEQARGLGKVDCRADIFSLGVTLYEALTFIRPFERKTREEQLEAVRSYFPLEPKKIIPRIPWELSVICMKCMEKSPGRRYQSMEDLANDLQRYLDQMPIKAKPPGRLYRAKKWTLRHPVLSTTFTAVAVVIVVLSYLSLELFRWQSRAEVFSTLQKLEAAVQPIDELWPLHPSLADQCEDTLRTVEELLSRKYIQREYLQEILSQMSPNTALDRYLFDGINSLAGTLDDYENPKTGLLDGVSLEHGWGLRRRIDKIQRLNDQTLQSPEASRRWRKAIQAISESSCYRGLKLEPQFGMLPLGENSDSGLWEFVHLLTGNEPRWNPDTGQLEIDGDSGLVFVLMPGGDFEMGGQDAELRRFDLQPDSLKETPHFVHVSPFFLSKYEMTRAQWKRVTGEDPSPPPAEGKGTESFATLPVSQISWKDCQQVLGRLDLSLPTEAQWEYAAKASTPWLWWSGQEPSSLYGSANLGSWSNPLWPGDERGEPGEQNDGFDLAAPVHSFKPNPFGLFNVLGNVRELCQDDLVPYYLPVKAGTAERAPLGRIFRVVRGGGFADSIYDARSSSRDGIEPFQRNHWIGVRPARIIQGENKDQSGWNQILNSQWITASVSDQYQPQTSVAMDEGTLIVGIPIRKTGIDTGSNHHETASERGEQESSGMVLILEKVGGLWMEVAKIEPPENAPYRLGFGASVSISGNTLIVGCHHEAHSENPPGAAFIFEREGGDWVLDELIPGPEEERPNYFGQAVRVSGDFALVGAMGSSRIQQNGGAVFVYRRVKDRWEIMDVWAPKDSFPDQFFGKAVAISGTFAAVGSSPPSGVRSSVHLYEFSSGRWSLMGILNNPTGVGNRFGNSVDLEGNTLVVGSCLDSEAALFSGAAFVYGRANDQWIWKQKLTASDQIGKDHFGQSVAISGNQILIGAHWKGAPKAKSGAAYLFQLRNGRWIEKSQLLARNANTGDGFGFFVDLNGATAVVGQAQWPWNQNAGSAKALVFDLENNKPRSSGFVNASGRKRE
ncbi:MAG: hypothetical protein DWQ01_04860 [Planctomycetota bacterium]|nr:MAG: hypothetical protein DWQ01_04860 [Planctomycetota bacterium]